MTTYFGFAIADSMFPAECRISKQRISVDVVRDTADMMTPCLNPSHTATIAAMQTRYRIAIAIPTTAPVVSLQPGDSIVVMTVRGLPRLEGRHEYTAEEIVGATFTFSEYTVE